MDYLSKSAAKIIFAIMTIFMLVALAGGIVSMCNNRQKARTETMRGDAAVEAGKTAIGAVVTSSGQESIIEQSVERAKDAINVANDVAGVHDAGIGGLCDLPSYRGSAQCVQRAGTAGMEKGNAGRGDARAGRGRPDQP